MFPRKWLVLSDGCLECPGSLLPAIIRLDGRPTLFNIEQVNYQI
jgi:hypothetical protein